MEESHGKNGCNTRATELERGTKRKHSMIDKEEHDRIQRQKKKKKEAEEAMQLAPERLTDEFVKLYLKPKKLDQYNGTRELDFKHLFEKYRTLIDTEVIIYLLEKLNADIDDFRCYLDDDDMILLFEKGLISEESLAMNIDEQTAEAIDLLNYYLQHDLPISVYWVAHLIIFECASHDKNIAEFLKGVQQKLIFTFDDVYEAGQDSFYIDDVRRFHKNVHEFFPDSDFEESDEEDYPYIPSPPEEYESDSDPGAPSDDQFATVSTENTNDLST